MARVAVLMGGWSVERDVSLTSGALCAAALREADHVVTEVDVTRDIDALIDALKPRPDVVFNALHGRYGEDGRIQGLLDMLAIPYTHSGVLASALAMDKAASRDLFANHGIPVAEGKLARRREIEAGDVMARPYVVKPLNEGSSIGVHIVTDGTNRPPLSGEPGEPDDIWLVERFVPGRELTVAVMDDRALAVTEIRPNVGFYDYNAKYSEGAAAHRIPAPIAPTAYEQTLAHALAAHRVLGCRGVSRADLRYDDTDGEPGRVVMLEVNTQPGMTPLSLVPEQAAHCGIPFGELVDWMVEHAACD